MVALTRREAEIARLAARGHTDSAIATMLAISIRSVESTLRSVFAKSNLPGRADLALLLPAEPDERNSR